MILNAYYNVNVGIYDYHSDQYLHNASSDTFLVYESQHVFPISKAKIEEYKRDNASLINKKR